MSFVVLTALVSPQALIVWFLDLPIQNALQGKKLGQNRGMGHQISILNKNDLNFQSCTNLTKYFSRIVRIQKQDHGSIKCVGKCFSQYTAAKTYLFYSQTNYRTSAIIVDSEA